MQKGWKRCMSVMTACIRDNPRSVWKHTRSVLWAAERIGRSPCYSTMLLMYRKQHMRSCPTIWFRLLAPNVVPWTMKRRPKGISNIPSNNNKSRSRRSGTSIDIIPVLNSNTLRLGIISGQACVRTDLKSSPCDLLCTHQPTSKRVQTGKVSINIPHGEKAQHTMLFLREITINCAFFVRSLI